MAFRASELRLILGIQAYGTTNLARLRRDITALGRTVDAQNLNQSRIQDQIVAKRTQVAKTAERIAKMETATASKRAVLEAQGALAAERFAQRRAALVQKEISLTNQLANKRVQLGKMVDRMDVMQGSGMQKFAVQESQLAQRRVGLENQKNTLQRQGIALQAQSLRNQAAEIAAARRLAAVAKSPVQFAELTRSLEAVHRLSETDADELVTKEAALRYHAVRTDAERIAAAQSHLPGQVAAVNKNLEVAAQQEKLIGQRKLEQAAALRRSYELYQAQAGQLDLINERLAAIKIEERTITAQEGLTNAQRERGIAILAQEEAALQREHVALNELIADEQRLSGIRMQQAIQADRMAQRIEKAQRGEVLGRTVAHVGRTAQFGGLIGTAAFVGAGAAAGEFGRNTALAGTQMRDVGGTFEQAARRGEELQNVIIELSQRFPSSANEMSDAAYEIFSSMNLVRNGVVDTQRGYQLLEVASKAAVAGQVNLEEATTAMITVLNNFDPNLKNVGDRMNEVFSIVRFGRMRLSDFAEAMTPLAPIAKTLNLELTDVGSALSTLTILFKSPQQAAQGLARAIELFNLKPFKDGMHEFGVEVSDAQGRMRPLHAIISDLVKEFPEMATGQKSAVELLTDLSKASGLTKAGIQGTVQARRAIAGLVTSMDLYENILSNVTNNQDEFNAAFDAMKDTPGVQWQVFINQLRAFALVVGRAALPVLLEFGAKVVDAAHWVQDLIDSTDGAIIKWGVWIGIGALLGGTLMNIVGSIIALVANLKIATLSFKTMGDEAALATAKTTLLSRTLTGLAGIGLIAIPIVMQMIKGGDPGLWDFLGGALSGAAGGAMIGSAIAPGPGTLFGAAAGAITVPIVLKIMQPDDIEQKLDMMEKEIGEFGKDGRLPRQFQRMFLEMGGTEKAAKMAAKIYRDTLNKEIPRTGEDVSREVGGARGPKKVKSIVDQYNEMFKTMSKEWMDSQKRFLDALTGGDEDKADAAVRKAKERARIVEDAWENMQSKIDTMVDKLAQTYEEFHQMNSDLMGDLGQGPVLTGFLGQIFDDINGLLMQFGQTVPLPIQLINRDLEMQIANFDKLREGYAQLLKRGVPQEVVKEIQQMGMAGLPFVQGLLAASGPEFNKFVKNIQTRQKDIEKYTKIDFENQLSQWRKYGSDIASEIIGGLSEEAAQAKLKMGFEKYVVDLFGATLKSEMAAEIAEAVKAAAEVDEASTAAEKAADAGANKNTKAARAARARLKAKQAAQARTQQEAANARLATDRATQTNTVDAPPVFPLFNPTFGKPGNIIQNYGDTNHIKADGATPNAIKRGMDKHSFERRNKKRR